MRVLGSACLGAIGGLLAGIIVQDLLAQLLVALSTPRALLATIIACTLPVTIGVGAAVPFVWRATARRRLRVPREASPHAWRS